MGRTQITNVAGSNAAPPAKIGDAEVFLTGQQVRTRYGVSDMTLYRWRSDATLGFPAPISINRRNYWREAELIAWERAKAGRAA